MTRDEVISFLKNNNRFCYTTDELWNNNEYIYIDHNGYIFYSSGDEIYDIEDLEEDGWYECTDMIDEDCADISYDIEEDW